MGRPARKTDGYNLPAPRNRGGRWTDQSIGKWLLIFIALGTLVGAPITLLALAELRGQGVDLRHVLHDETKYALLPGGVGSAALSLVVLLVKDRASKHMASLQIDSDSNAQKLEANATKLGEVDGKVGELSTLSAAMTRAIQDTRSDVGAVRGEVSQLAATILQLQQLLVARAAPAVSLYPAPEAAPMPHVKAVPAYVTGATALAEQREKTPDPFDTSRPWIREDTGARPAVYAGDDLPPSLVDQPGQPRSAYEIAQERFAYGETGTVPTVLPDLPPAAPDSTDPNLDEHLRGGPDLYGDYYRSGGEHGTT